MLLEAFAANVIEQVKIEPLRKYAEQIIIERLSETNSSRLKVEAEADI